MYLKIRLLVIFLMFSFYIQAQDWKTYPYNPSGSLISYSLDEGRHASEPVEWWYTSGLVSGTTSGKEYSYMLTYFYYPQNGFDGIRILNITDHTTGEFHQDTKQIRYTTLSNSRLDIEVDVFLGGTETWTNKLDGASAIIPFEYTLSASASFGGLNFEYETLKRPLILGDDGYLFQASSNYTYYYSQTKNEVIGTLTLNGVTENITGTSWIDHQYGDFNPFLGESYEWFSLQLSNGMDINLSTIFTPESTIPENDKYRNLSSYVNESTQYTSNDFQIERLEYVFMPDNQTCYSKKWRLTSTLNNIDLTITTLLDNTEVQIPIRFYEGATTISGTVNGIAVTGNGFAELLHPYEHPDVTISSPNGGVYNTSAPINWQLNNPDEGRPIFYDISYSNDNQQNFISIAQGLTDSTYLWDGSGLNDSDEVWFKIVSYSIDGVLNSTVISSAASTVTLSIKTLNELQFTMYPNPVETHLYLSRSESIGKASCQIFDINGRLVKGFELTPIMLTIDVRFLKGGVYFMAIKNEKGNSILKFVKK